MSTRSTIASGRNFHLYRDCVNKDYPAFLEIRIATSKDGYGDGNYIEVQIGITQDDLEELRRGLLGDL